MRYYILVYCRLSLGSQDGSISEEIFVLIFKKEGKMCSLPVPCPFWVTNESSQYSKI
jgi:hypothetical protein